MPIMAVGGGIRVFQQQSITPWRLACAILVASSAAVFGAALTGVAIWDDASLINGSGTGNTLLQVFTRPFLGSYFRPLVSLSFYLDRHIWGVSPFGYHQTNLLIHALNTAVMISLLMTAFHDRRIAFIGAAVFAYHPVHVSAVAWIGGRTDPMLCLFMTTSALCLIRSAQSAGAARRRLLGWATFWYLLALLCKEQALALLPLAPLAYRFFGRADHVSEDKSEGRIALFSFGSAAAAFLICWLLIAPPKQGVFASGFVNYALRAGDTLLAYAALLVSPSPTWMHTFTLGPTERFGVMGAVVGFVSFAALGIFVCRAWLKGSQAAWWGLWVLLALLPVSNLVPIASLLTAPYRAEIAQVALCALAGWRFVTAWDRLTRPPRAALGAAGSAAGAWCVYLCLWGSGLWIHPENIFGQISRVDPDCIFAREALVQSMMSRNNLPEASRELEMLLERLMPNGRWRDPTEVKSSMQKQSDLAVRLRKNQGETIAPNVWLSNVYAQLGILRSKEGKLQEAQTYLETAAILDVNCVDALVELGLLALRRGDHKNALAWATRAITRAPEVADAWSLRGKSHIALGRLRKAENDLEQCVALQPWAGQAHIELAEVRTRLGDRKGAASTLAEALIKSPRRDDIRKRLSQL